MTKKVALVSHSPSFAGAEKMLFALGCFLKKGGLYAPIMYLPTDPIIDSFASACNEAELEVCEMPANTYYIYSNKENASQIALEALEHSRILAQMLTEQGIDLVVCNTATSLVPALAARKVNIPVVLWMHGILDGFYIPAEQSDLELRLMYDRILMYLSDEVVCCSNWVEDYYRPLCMRPVSTICNWSPTPKSTCEIKSKSEFVCLNTFESHKGVGILLKAALLLKKREYKFHIELYGTGVEEQRLKDYVSKHRLDDYVKFCGRTNNVEKVYQRAFCLIQPCFLESFGLTITEAMSQGRPVIATNSGGPKQIVLEGETGYLVPPRDEEALADKMAYLLDHPDEACEMGLNGKKRYQELFSPEKATKDFLKLFERVLSRQTPVNLMDRFVDDLITELLRAQMLPHTGILASAQTLHRFRPVYPENQLCFSGAIQKSRCYCVTCDRQRISTVSLLFACHDPETPSGELVVQLMQGKTEIGKGSIPLSSIGNDVWTDIALQNDCICEKGKLDVKFTFLYQENSGRLGVYENRTNRTFLYKVFNKLGAPLKGTDALIVQLQE